MKKISKWAKTNPISSRIIIGISHVLVVLNAVFFGTLLFVLDWGESRWLLAVTGILFFASYIFYPKKSKEKKTSYYVRQKAHDFSLVILYPIVISLGLNNYLTQNINDNYTIDYSINDNNLDSQPVAKFIVHKPKSKPQKTNRKKLKSEVKEKAKKLRKQIKQELRKFKKDFKKNNDKGNVIGAIIVTIIFGLFFGWLIAWLSCHLSCSGYAGLAYIVLILGWASIIALGIIFIKKTLKNSKKKKATNASGKN